MTVVVKVQIEAVARQGDVHVVGIGKLRGGSHVVGACHGVYYVQRLPLVLLLYHQLVGDAFRQVVHIGGNDVAVIHHRYALHRLLYAAHHAQDEGGADGKRRAARHAVQPLAVGVIEGGGGAVGIVRRHRQPRGIKRFPCGVDSLLRSARNVYAAYVLYRYLCRCAYGGVFRAYRRHGDFARFVRRHHAVCRYRRHRAVGGGPRHLCRSVGGIWHRRERRRLSRRERQRGGRYRKTFDLRLVEVAVGIVAGFQHVHKSVVIAFAVVAIYLRGVFGMVDEGIAVALNAEHHFVAANFLLGRRFFKVPLQQSGNFAYRLAASGAVYKFQIVLVAPPRLNVEKYPCRRAAVSLCGVEKAARLVAQRVNAVFRIAVAAAAVFFDYVGRGLRHFVEVEAAAGAVELRFRGAQVVSVAARTALFGKGSAAVLWPHVLAVGVAYASAQPVVGHGSSGIKPNYVAVIVGIGVRLGIHRRQLVVGRLVRVRVRD